VFEPLGMADSSFGVPAEKQGRFTTAYIADGAAGLRLLDPPAGGWWNGPPATANAAGMLVLDAGRLLDLRLHVRGEVEA
jgi:CubicO group peptidase (beta-lactamase class C family)